MKKIYYLIYPSILILVGFNIFFFLRMKKESDDYQKARLTQRVNICGSYIEEEISSYENDLTRILFKNFNDLPDFFTNPKVFSEISADLHGLYSKNRNLISNISVFDDKDSYLGIYMKENDELVVDTFPQQFYNELQSKDIIIKEKGFYRSYFPFFKNDRLTGNVVVEINIEEYLNTIFQLFRLTGLQFQWVISSNEQIMLCNHPDSIKLSDIDIISKSIKDEEELVYEHYYTNPSGIKKKVISATYPLSVLNNDLGIVFSLETGQLNKLFIRKYFFICMFSLLVLIVLLFIVVYYNSLEKKSQIKRTSDLLRLKMIVEHLPVGIMITDSIGRIMNINRSAQQMLFLEKDEDITGKLLSDQLMVSNKYLLTDGISESFDANHFIHYEKDGKETIIYRKDIKAQITGEELTLSALIDVTQHEKSRRQDMAVNRTKSDLLEKMGNEIFTPLKTIIESVSQLDKKDPQNKGSDEIKTIKHSAEVIVNSVNDIIDFSRTDTRQLLPEEFPFNLRSELEYIISEFRSSAESKGLTLQLKYNSDLPEFIIGDPLKLRQVLRNLISNANKFTDEGSIQLTSSVYEKIDSQLTLLFRVDDTGPGIPPELQHNIFESPQKIINPASGKTESSGFGLTVSRQLVELMNGEIWIESPSHETGNAKNPGTSVFFTIEVNSFEKLKKKYDFSDLEKLHKITVLIVSGIKEDEDSVHLLLDRFGINYNFITLDEESLENVVTHLEQNKELYQMLMILDKAEYDGFSIARKFKDTRLSDKLPVILISSNHKTGNYSRAKANGIDYYIINPYETAEIYRIIIEVFPGLKDLKGVSSHVSRIRKDLRILIVEDNSVQQRQLQGILKHLGFEAAIVSNGMEFLEKISTAAFDVVFMNGWLPDIDSIELIERVRKLGHKFPIMAVIPHEGSESHRESIYSKVNDIVYKPPYLQPVKEIFLKWFSEPL